METIRTIGKKLKLSETNIFFMNNISHSSYPNIQTYKDTGMMPANNTKDELKQFCDYCESNSLWDKVDGYYKIKYLLN